MVHCCDAVISYFVAKLWCKAFAHFHAAAVKHHSTKVVCKMWFPMIFHNEKHVYWH
jgi:hypothetical protein